MTEKILNELNVNLIIRSHQPNLATSGPNFKHKDKIITISSTSVYGGKPHCLEIPGSKISEIAKYPNKIKEYTKFL